MTAAMKQMPLHLYLSDAARLCISFMLRVNPLRLSWLDYFLRTFFAGVGTYAMYKYRLRLDGFGEPCHHGPVHAVGQLRRKPTAYRACW